MIDYEKLLMSALMEIKMDGPVSQWDGICGNVDKIVQRNSFDELEWEAVPCTGVSRIMLELFTEWPRFSGDAFYPILGTSRMSPQLYYALCKEKWQGEYGDSRRELVDFLIEKLKSDKGKWNAWFEHEKKLELLYNILFIELGEDRATTEEPQEILARLESKGLGSNVIGLDKDEILDEIKEWVKEKNEWLSNRREG